MGQIGDYFGAATDERVAELEAENERLRTILGDIHMLALEASEEYEDSCRAKVSRIYSLSNVRGAEQTGGKVDD